MTATIKVARQIAFCLLYLPNKLADILLDWAWDVNMRVHDALDARRDAVGAPAKPRAALTNEQVQASLRHFLEFARKNGFHPDQQKEAK